MDEEEKESIEMHIDERTNTEPDKASAMLFGRADFVRLVIPLMLDLALTLLVGMIDSVMVASVGEDAVSGVSLIDNVMQLLIMVFTAFGTGGAVVAGQYLGAGDKHTACRTTTELIWFSGLVSFVLMGVVFGIRGWILGSLFGTITPEVYYHANRYLLMTALSIPAISLYQSAAAVFRTMNQSQKMLKLTFLMNLVNMVGNAIFIYGCRLGTFGAALSTTIARMLAAVIAVVMLLDKSRMLYLEKSLSYRPDRELIRKILYIGIPNGVENGLFQLGKILVLSLISKFGTAAIAANSIATMLAGIECIPGNSLQMACTTVIARCVGAGDEKQTRYYNKVILVITYVVMFLISVVLCLFLPSILRMYHLSDEAYRLTTQMVIMHSVGGVVIWPLTFVLPASLRAAGDVRYAMNVSVISMWVFRIMTSYILAWYLGVGAIGVWIAMQCDWLFRTICFVWRWRSGKWRGKSVIQQRSGNRK